MLRVNQPQARLGRQAIHALVEWIARVTLDPVPAHLVSARKLVQPAPQVLVLDGLTVLCPPAPRMPVVDPLCDPLAKVPRVGVELDLAAIEPPVQVVMPLTVTVPLPLRLPPLRL